MHDSIEGIRALVGWLTRDAAYISLSPGLTFRFEISDANMRDLAHLSDKYIIDALQKDIRVSSGFSCANSLTMVELCLEIRLAKIPTDIRALAVCSAPFVL